MLISDRDMLLYELEELEKLISLSPIWTVSISNAFLRKETVLQLLKSLGKKDWFKPIQPLGGIK